MKTKAISNIRHLDLRAGFGLTLDDWKDEPDAAKRAARLVRNSKTPEPLLVVSDEEWEEYRDATRNKEMTTGPERQMRLKSFREKVGDLNQRWMREMVTTGDPLREKIALFWHNHFATRVNNPYFDQQLLHIIRTHALGSFRTLLCEVSQSPSMLQFLNNQQNRKQHPNENFAREVMELFTLGRGHYTEQDVKEAARAFTGWGFGRDGQFTFRKNRHDDGEKTILGKAGHFHGEDVLDILLAQRQCALFVTGELYRYLVTEEQPDQRRIRALADEFYESDYNIGTLVQSILTAGWFYNDDVKGSRIKSPVDLLVGYQRLLPMQFSNPRTLINLQRSLGQLLFYPPNVAGWPGGRDWIDSSSLVIRMCLPEAFWGSRELDLTPKEIDAEMNDVNKKPMQQDAQAGNRFRVGRVDTDWTGWTDHWKKKDNDRLPELLARYLMAKELTTAQLQELIRFTDKDNTEEYIRSLTIRLMSLPEYQLC